MRQLTGFKTLRYSRIKSCQKNQSMPPKRTRLFFPALAALLLVPVLHAQTCDRIHISHDRFEVGFSDRLAVFRINSLELEHPHTIFDDPGELNLFCQDATNDPLEIIGTEVFAGVNPELDARIDAHELNLLNELNPFGQEDGLETCLAGMESDDLFLQAPTEIQRTGTCVETISGLFDDDTWPDGGTTQPNLPGAGSAGCHVSAPVDAMLTLSLDDSDLALFLRDLVVAARFDDEPSEALLDGVMYGFLTEDDANDIIITVDSFELNLGEDILPSDGSGDGDDCQARTHCKGPDARVTHQGQCGWWFVFNFTAERIR